MALIVTTTIKFFYSVLNFLALIRKVQVIIKNPCGSGFRFQYLASSCPRIKLHEIQCHFQEVSHRRARGDRRDYLNFFFSAFSHRGVGHRPYGPEAANSAVNYYVSRSIRLAAFQARAGPAVDPFSLPSSGSTGFHRLNPKIPRGKNRLAPGKIYPGEDCPKFSFLPS